MKFELSHESGSCSSSNTFNRIFVESSVIGKLKARAQTTKYLIKPSLNRAIFLIGLHVEIKYGRIYKYICNIYII